MQVECAFGCLQHAQNPWASTFGLRLRNIPIFVTTVCTLHSIYKMGVAEAFLDTKMALDRQTLNVAWTQVALSLMESQPASSLQLHGPVPALHGGNRPRSVGKIQ